MTSTDRERQDAREPRPPLFLGRFQDSVLLGFLLALLAHGAVIPLLLRLNWSVGFALVGASQLLWLGPLFLTFRSRGLRRMAKGVLIVLGLTLLVNTTCFGLLAFGGGLGY